MRQFHAVHESNRQQAKDAASIGQAADLLVHVGVFVEGEEHVARNKDQVTKSRLIAADKSCDVGYRYVPRQPELLHRL